MVDISQLPDLDTATSDDGIVVYDHSAAEEARIREVKFSGEVGDYLNGVGAFVSPDTLAAISKVVNESTDVVDVFVYNTKDDSDEGLWRKTCHSLSWYNEELNTATRGATREFPAIALIVATSDTVTIYDLNANDTPMWMVFEGGLNKSVYSDDTKPITSLAMIYGVMCVTCSGLGGLSTINFIDDYTELRISSLIRYFSRNIAGRNTNVTTSVADYYTGGLIDRDCQGVAMTTLSGNDYPTIAVATAGGCSIINGPVGENTVVDITGSTTGSIGILNTRILILQGRTVSFGGIPTTNDTVNNWRDGFYSRSSIPAILDCETAIGVLPDGTVGTSDGITLLKENTTTPANGMVAYIDTEQPPMWQQGDIKLATLADTTEETIGTDTTTEQNINADFSDGDTGWTLGSGWSISGGQAIHDNVSGFTVIEQTAPPLVLGEMYTATIDIATITDSGIVFYLGGVSAYVSLDTVGVHTVTFRAVGSRAYIGAVGDTLNSFSIKKSQNLVENGEFSSDRSWTLADLWSISNGELIGVGDGLGLASARQSFGSIGGAKYLLKYEVTVATNLTDLDCIISIGSGAFEALPITAIGSYSVVIEVPVSGDDLQFRLSGLHDAGDTVHITNVSIELLDVPDRSSNNNPLMVVGQIDKAPVAGSSLEYTESELVGWSGFSPNDFVFQPYNSGLDLGTGDFRAKINSSSGSIGGAQGVFSIGTSGVLALGLNFTSTNIQIYLGDVIVIDTPYVVSNMGYICTEIVREDSLLSLYINSKLIASVANSTNITTANSTLNLGKDHDNRWCGATDITLFALGATAPSSDQIKDIYDTEKLLFQEGASCTLQGSDDEVLSLAYDPDTDVHYVGQADAVTEIYGNAITKLSTSLPANNTTSLSAVGGYLASGTTTEANAYLPEIRLREDPTNERKRDLDNNVFGGDTDYSEFEDDGTLVMRGGATVWEDINLDPTNLTGNGNDPTLTTIASTGLTGAGFSGAQTDEVQGCFEYPHKAKLNAAGETSTTFDFHCHLLPTTSDGGDVRLSLEYAISNSTTEVATSTTVLVTATLGTTPWLLQTVAFGANIPAPETLGSQVHFRVARLGGDALDTSSAVVVVPTIGAHYEADTLGSREALEK